MRSGSRIVFFGFIIAMLAVYAACAWWSPVQDDDWKQWVARHGTNAAWTWFATHFTVADALAYVLSHSQLVTTIVTPLAHLLLVLGAVTVALRRLPRLDSWDDVLAVLAFSALLWIGQPRAGFTFFHRTSVGWHVAGCALALWTLAPFRCGWRPGVFATVPLMLLALVAGTTTRQIATPLVIGLAVVAWRERERWQIAVVVALFIGTVIGYVAAPPIEIAKAVYRGVDQALVNVDKPMREGAQVIVVVMLFALGKLLVQALRPAEGGTAPDARDTQRWLWLWFGIILASLFGPAYNEATVLPATVALCIAAVPLTEWLAATRLVRIALWVFVVGLHVALWATALVKYAGIGAEFHDRMARIDATPKGDVAVVRPYTEIQPTTWFAGEDWAKPGRQLVAIEGFGVKDLDFDPTFRRLETNPRLEIKLEIEGVSADHVAAYAPAIWGTELSTARTQFEKLVRALRRGGDTTFTARLVVSDLRFAQAAGRPIYAAWYEDGKLVAPRVSRTGPDAENLLTISVPGGVSSTFTESYLVREEGTQPLTRQGRVFHLQISTVGRVAIVGCDAKRCLAVDAFLPRF